MARTTKHLEAIPTLGVLNAVTEAFCVTDYDNISFSLTGANTSQLTVQVLGSLKKAAPDFSAAKAADNEYDTIVVQDYEDDAAIEGDTGIAFTENDIRQCSASVNGLDWIAFKVSAYTSGDVTPKLSCHNNS